MTEQYTSPQSRGWTEGFDISESLNKQTKAIGQSVTGFTSQTVNPIKSTVSDIQSGIALIKEKDREFISKIHSYKSETIDTINNYLSNLTGGRLNFADFGKVISYKDGFNINKDQLMNMAGKALGFNIKNLPNDVDNLANEFLTELNGMTLGLADGLVNINGDRITIAGDWDRKIGENVFSFLTNSSSSFKTIRNFAASNAILNVMVNKNASVGFVDGFKPFGEQYLYESDYHAALIKSISILLVRGDVNSLKEVLSILGKVSTIRVRVTYPRFIETVLMAFHLPDNTPIEDYGEYGEKLITIIETVFGNNWMYSNTFMGDVIDIGLAYGMSESSALAIGSYTQTLLKQAKDSEITNKTQSDSMKEKAGKLLIFITASGKIPIEEADVVFKRDFPNAVTFK